MKSSAQQRKMERNLPQSRLRNQHEKALFVSFGQNRAFFLLIPQAVKKRISPTVAVTKRKAVLRESLDRL